MKRYIAQTTIALLQALVLIFMAPAFMLVFVVVAAWTAVNRSYDWITLHAFHAGDEQAKRKADWRAS